MLTTDGLNATLDGNVWGENLYIGLIGSSGFTETLKADTMSSHAGWSEIHSEYSEGARPQWSYGSASGGVVSAIANFSFTSSATVKGFFVTTDSTKNGSSGSLVHTQLFSSGEQSWSPGQILQLTLTGRAAQGA
jgi:hypothetical protein